MATIPWGAPFPWLAPIPWVALSHELPRWLRRSLGSAHPIADNDPMGCARFMGRGAPISLADPTVFAAAALVGAGEV